MQHRVDRPELDVQQELPDHGHHNGWHDGREEEDALARGAFPHAEAAAAETLALPIYGELTAEQQRAVVESIADYYAA